MLCTMHLWANLPVRKCLLLISYLLKECTGLGSGLLSSGLTLAITTISLDTKDVIQSFATAYNVTATDNATKTVAQYNFTNSAKLLEAGKSIF